MKGPLAADARTRTFSPMTTLVLALHLAATVPFAPKPIAPPPDFDAYVARVLTAFEVPGAAVAT